MSNLLGYHYVGSTFTEAHVAAHMEHLRATNPSWITVHGAEQYKEALAFAKLVRRDLPETRVIFRHCINRTEPGGAIIDSRDDDTGRHARMTAQSWWDNIGSRYIGSGLTILTDNESGAADLTYYSQWQAKVMELAARDGVSLATGRFSTHNPPAAQWLQLDDMWRALDDHYHLHIFSPNVYFSDTNFDGIEHIFGAWQRCADIGVKPPQTVVGEFAYAYNIDPHKGYRWVKMSGADYVTRLIQRGAPLWGAGIAACIYSIGEWPINEDTFSLDEDALKALQDRVVSSPPPIIVPPPPAPPPTENHPPKPQSSDPRFDQDSYKAVPTEAGSNTVIREFPNPKSDKLTVLEQTGLLVGHIPPANLNPSELAYQNASGVLWQVIRLPDDRVGYSHSKYIGLTKVVPPVEPPPIVVPPVEPPPIVVPPPPPDYVTRAEAQKMVRDAIQELRDVIYAEVARNIVAALSRESVAVK